MSCHLPWSRDSRIGLRIIFKVYRVEFNTKLRTNFRGKNSLFKRLVTPKSRLYTLLYPTLNGKSYQNVVQLLQWRLNLFLTIWLGFVYKKYFIRIKNSFNIRKSCIMTQLSEYWKWNSVHNFTLGAYTLVFGRFFILYRVFFIKFNNFSGSK